MFRTRSRDNNSKPAKRAAQRSTLPQHLCQHLFRRSILPAGPVGNTCPAEAVVRSIHMAVVLAVRPGSSLAVAVVVGRSRWALVLEGSMSSAWALEPLRRVRYRGRWAGSMGRHRGGLAQGTSAADRAEVGICCYRRTWLGFREEDDRVYPGRERWAERETYGYDINCAGSQICRNRGVKVDGCLASLF